MVKFGKHIEVFADTENKDGLFYLVPYNDVKASVHDRGSFEEQWRLCLEMASNDFARVTQEFWSRIFARIRSLDDEARGALPGTAISLYVQLLQQERQNSSDTAANGPDQREDPQELLVMLKQIYEVAYRNTEALRKLVKKYDKRVADAGDQLSPILLPLVYSANFTIGQPNLEEGIELLRQLLLGEGGESIGATPSGYEEDGYASDQSNHDALVQERKAELDWLRRLTKSLEPSELSNLVAHRGFHSVHDHSHVRPIENSLTAYESAWTSGIHLCECDIALTKDEKLVLAHDETFSRLALNKHAPESSQKIQDLTFRELMAMPLTSSSRPPLLVDVLRSAETIGDNAQLVIEIKPGNEAAATALAQLLADHPEFWSCIAVIMSFDYYTLNRLRQELQRSFAALMSEEQVADQAVPVMGHRHSRSRSISFSAGLDVLTVSLTPVLSSGALNAATVSPGSGQFRKQFLPPSPSHTGLLQRTQLGSSSLLPPKTDGTIGSYNLLPPVKVSDSKSKLLPPAAEQGESHWMVGISPETSHHDLTKPPPSPLMLGKAAEAPVPHPPPVDRHPTRIQMPKLMLLTVADPPKRACDLRVGVDDLSPVLTWMRSGGEDGEKSLDGVYLQYQPEMLEPAGAAALRELGRDHAVGVWTFSDVGPDDYETFRRLVHDAGVTYFNTDLPLRFREGVHKTGGREYPRYKKASTMPY